MTRLPALRDAHVHSALADLAAVRRGGIAAVTDLGGVPADLARLGGPGLPVVRYAGAFLTAPGGYPSDRAWAPPGCWRFVRSPADAAEAAAEQRAAGATLLKVCLNADAGPVPDRATVAAVVAAGLPVVAHAQGPGMVELALDAGVPRLAHTPWTGPLDDGLLRACAARQVWISTLAIHGGGDRDAALRNLRLFLGHGGEVRYGTDLGNGPQPPGVNPHEVRALQSAGLSPDDVLAAMTAVDPDDLPAPDCVVPGGLDLGPARFADSLATARVAD
ncbi:amidohydrolase [Spirilliplanes yamanashiensis]|uniref:Amidohydrolase n=1 Tax=Spirilliplanes yamanashiensis TaxID=42233 RepID=A0A8J4DLI6_9ACTN|nr:amidohydrolase [Spirilliplanes yamanashiensis]MDP9818973.1 hypothetical protein [Spirilliplanes yamanashiensis]GIJ05428.1 hypothetical protein Sya03_47800 [Spirilliplanes yamanashiensis]